GGQGALPGRRHGRLPRQADPGAAAAGGAGGVAPRGVLAAGRRGAGLVGWGMGAFRRVEGEQAGPAALGILVPPGRGTFLIVRPRALPWDLLWLRGDGPAFRELAHDEASAAAQALYATLRRGEARVAPAQAAGEGFWLRVTVGPFTLLACPRTPGRP